MQPRSLLFEQLEARALLTAVIESQVLDSFNITGNVGEKPESKLWKHADHWWGVFSDSGGTHVWRLDGQTWNKTLNISSLKGIQVDAKADGDVTHVLFENNLNSQLYSLQYVPGSVPTYAFWNQRSAPASVKLASSVEAATIDLDSNGRMWVAYDDEKKNIEVRYSDAPYNTWSNPIVLANNVNGDDIAALTALPNGTIGVLWSNQTTKQFGFRTHVDGTDPAVWTADEVPASHSALNIDFGFADDHINLAVSSDATLYAAIKTSYFAEGTPEMGILVRRPNGVWDDFHDLKILDGTRPIIQLNEVTNTLIFSYNDDSNWVYHECNAITIACSTPKVLVSEGENATSTKQNVTSDLVVLTSGKSKSGKVYGTLLKFNTVNSAPFVDAGSDQSIWDTQLANLLGAVADDGLPAPPATLTTSWNQLSGPGLASFADSTASSTSVSFSEQGSYVLELVANDGEFTSQDTVTLTVLPTPPNQTPVADAGKDQVIVAGSVAVLSGSFLDDDQPVSPQSVVITWSQVSGPDGASILNASSLQTAASFTQPGTYVFQLSVDDTELVGTDTMTITVITTPETKSFQDGLFPTVAYAGTRDTKLSADKQKNHYGKDKKLEVVGRHDFTSLLKWDVTEVGSSKTVLGASLTLNVENTTKNNYNIYGLLKDWEEGDATFLQSAKNVSWNTPGAAGVDQDRGANVVGALAASKKGLVTIELNADGAALVQKWVSDPATNHGLIIQDFSDALTDDVELTSREGSKSIHRPKLTIRYASPNSPPTAPLISSPSRNGDNPFDVNADTQVTPLDALSVINWLNSGPAEGEEAAPRAEVFLDVSGDGRVSPLDALMIINFLNDFPPGDSEDIGEDIVEGIGEGEGTDAGAKWSPDSVLATGLFAGHFRLLGSSNPHAPSRLEPGGTTRASFDRAAEPAGDSPRPQFRLSNASPVASPVDWNLAANDSWTLSALGEELFSAAVQDSWAAGDPRSSYFAQLAHDS